MLGRAKNAAPVSGPSQLIIGANASSGSPSSIFPAMLARAYDAPLFAARLAREPGVRFDFCIEQIPLAKSHDRHADIATASAALQAAFERSIRAAPEQWMWAHRRWG